MPQGLMSIRRAGVVLATILCVLLWSAPAHAQIVALTATQQANVQLVITNLNGLVTAGRAAVAANPNDPQADAKKKELDRLAEISRNLAAKLAAGSIHSVPGLTSGRPRKYRHGDDVSSPRAAYCDDDTYIRNGNGWAQCTEGDIVVDGGILDPGNGVAINEANFAGWQRKWTLLHVLTHEKMHAILINEQVTILKAREWWKYKTDAEKAKLIREAKTAGATSEKHQEVYEMQKNVLRWERYLLEAELKTLEAANPKNPVAIAAIKEKIKWLRDTVTKLETSMAKATQGEEFANILECVPEAPKDGYAEAVVNSPGLTWTLEALRANGATQSVTTLASDWLGERVQENPAHEPSIALTMDEQVLSAGDVQPDLCEYVSAARAQGELQVARLGAAAQAETGQGGPILKGVLVGISVKPPKLAKPNPRGDESDNGAASGQTGGASQTPQR